MSLQATRAGSPVEDLTPGDLRLFDDNHEVAITTFEKVSVIATDPGRIGKTTSSARRADRLSVLLLDALNTCWSDQIDARRAAARVLDQIPETERIAIFILGDGLRLVHDFSSDRASLKALVQALSGLMSRDELDSAGNPFAAEFSYSDLGRTKESGQLAALRQRQRILETFQALTAIARLLKSAPGQKNLLWLSAGFPLRVNGPRGPLDTESFHDEAARTTRELNTANLTIYPIDARGVSINSSAYINIGTMQELAERTGGKAYYSSNDLASLVRSAFEDSRRGYLLTYTPSDLQHDGKYHTIRLRTTRHGVQLRYRPGYSADTQQFVRH